MDPGGVRKNLTRSLAARQVIGNFPTERPASDRQTTDRIGTILGVVHAMDADHIKECVMTTIGVTQYRSRTMARPVQSKSAARQVLLACGIFSSLLYVAADVLGGLRYEGYSFISQAISELGAIQAPSKPFVDRLFTVYNLLALLFGIGVLRAAGGRNRALGT